MIRRGRPRRTPARPTRRRIAALIAGALAHGLVPMLAQSPTTSAARPPRVTTEDITRHAGREVTVCGRVVMYDCQASSGALAFDLDTPHSRRDGITVYLPRPHWGSSLGEGLTNRYVFAHICARGKVRKAGPRYRVAVSSRDAIEIVSPPPPGTILLDASAAQSCAQGMKPPALLREVKPSYTGEAFRARLEGPVHLEAVVQPDGSVGDVRTLAGLDPDLGLHANAVTALKQWRFTPATVGGRAVPVLVTVEMTFTMK